MGFSVNFRRLHSVHPAEWGSEYFLYPTLQRTLYPHFLRLEAEIVHAALLPGDFRLDLL